MNHQSKTRRFLFCLLQACGIGLLAGSWASAAFAAGPTLRAFGPAASPTSRAFGPAAGGAGSGATASPASYLPDLYLDNGVRIGGTYLPYVSAGAPTVRSSVMIHSPNGVNGLGCRFPLSFGIRNSGTGPTPSSFDVYVYIRQGQRTVNSVGYSMNLLQPGTVESEQGGFDVLPGSYGLALAIDPYHRVKQLKSGDKTYLIKFNAVCGNGIFSPPGGPAMHMPAPTKNPGPGGHAGASGRPAMRNPGPGQFGRPAMRQPGPGQ
jgi:hypothetical protein